MISLAWLRSRGVRYTVWPAAIRRFSAPDAIPGRSTQPVSERVDQKVRRERRTPWRGLAAFAGLGLVAVFLRRRRPGGLGRRDSLSGSRPIEPLGGGERNWNDAAPGQSNGCALFEHGRIPWQRLFPVKAPNSPGRSLIEPHRWQSEELDWWWVGHFGRSRLFEPGRVVGPRRFPADAAVRVVSRLALLAAGIGVVATVWLNGG